MQAARIRAVLGVLLFASHSLLADEAPAAIQDNSFLLEEAYNQDAGVIQHISLLTHSDEQTAYAFTEEWPIGSIRHQISITLPMSRNQGFGTGIGDVAVNYRYQLLGDGDAKVAVAPRISLLLDTGSEEEKTGSGSNGVQINFPLSVRAADRWVAHTNAGATWMEARNEGIVNLGQSVNYLVSSNFNLVLETVWAKGDGDETFYVSPGLRWAIDRKSGLQIVPGIAVPFGIGVSSDEPAQVLLYLSFEHPLH